MTFASLPDEVIRQVRIGVMLLAGSAAAVVGAVMLLSSSLNTESWERVNALAWVVCASCCYATAAVTRTTLIRMSEVMVILTAYFCTASIVITGSPLSSLVLGASAYALVVLLPGIAFRTRSFRASAYNVACVCAVYITSVAIRGSLHGETVLDSWSEFTIKLFIPPAAFWVLWFMVRALNQRILEALQESERARNALAVSNQLLELANRSLESARIDAERARDGAEAANRAKSQFLANMSHELRTPLNSIIGYTELIMDEAREDESTRVRQVMPDLKNVVLSAKHLLGLIGGILDLSKIEAGRMELIQEQFNVVDFVREVEQTILPQARKRRNSLVIDCNEDIGSVIADRGKLKQILLNLLGNSVKFTNDGEIGLSAHRDPGESILTFKIRDTGIGIEPDKLAVIFEKFTQIDASPTRRYEGAGLGLAITRELCAMMGADIDVISKPGDGTVFTIKLPIAPVVPPSVSLSGQLVASAAGIR
ncbi:MAG: HAMP domain-containing histidine kinase [Myxococcales bacterium]|nr:HAMP domain-containing histidine kinase [Myxococcales bacterium]